MFSLFKKKHFNETVLVFDIGNGSIGGAFVEFNQFGVPRVLFSHREPLAYLPHASSQKLFESMLKLLTSVSQHLRKEGYQKVREKFGPRTIARAFCVFSSPWYLCQTKVIKIQRNVTFPISNEFIGSILRKDQDLFIQEMKDGTYEKMFGTKVKLLEKKIIHTKLNGYEIADFINKPAREFEMTFFSSFVSAHLLESVEQKIHNEFSVSKVVFHSFALASWNAISDLYPQEKDYIFLDITGEVTDVMYVKDGVLLQTASYPIGRSTLLRHIVKTMSVTPEVAVSFLALYSKGYMDKKFSDTMETVITEVKTAWTDALVKTLKEISQTVVLPRKVFFTADIDVSNVFAKGLQDFESTFIHSDAIQTLAVFAPEAEKDPFIALESEFLNKLAAAV